ncbi:15118_t:CDS:1, partial [Funneliformis caledonium]
MLSKAVEMVFKQSRPQSYRELMTNFEDMCRENVFLDTIQKE